MPGSSQESLYTDRPQDSTAYPTTTAHFWAEILELVMEAKNPIPLQSSAISS